MKVDLDKLVEEIGTNGAKADTALGAELRKGLTDGFGALAALIKGMGKAEKPEPKGDDKGEEPHEEPDGDEDGDDQDGDGDGKGEGDDKGDGEGGGAPGYPLQKGEEFIDATDFVVSMGQRLAALEKADKARASSMATLIKQNHELLESNRILGEAIALGVQPLYKSMIDLRDAVSRNAGPSVVSATNRLAAEAGLAAARAAAPVGDLIDRSTLATALRKGVIDHDSLSRYTRTGKFSDDEAVNADLVKKVKASIAA